MTRTNDSHPPRKTRTGDLGVRKINFADLLEAISLGIADFNAMPTHLFYLAIIYPIVTFVAAGIYGDHDMLPVIFPLLAGYTLLGPIVAIGTYELSRRREFGRYTSWTNAFLVFKSHSINAIVNLGIVLMLFYFAWLFAAQAIYEQNFGAALPESVWEFATQVFTTREGLTMIFMGCGIGFLFAVIVLALSVVSFPMLLDLDVGIIQAVKTSITAVIVNPIMMAVWGVIVATSLLVGSLPFFVGLCVVLPVIGHATWHLYRKIVET